MDQNANGEMGKKFQELQVLEQQLQQGVMQKQAVQVELNEVLNAISEIAKAKDEVYRIIGGIMMRADPETLQKELTEKKRVLDLRIQALEKQEKIVEDKARKLREDLNSAVRSAKTK